MEIVSTEPEVTSNIQQEAKLLPEGNRPPPSWVWVLISGVLIFSAIYLVGNIDDFSTRGWLHPPADTTAAAPVAVNGDAVYGSRCASCHQATGAGVPGVFPPLAGDVDWVTGEKGRLIRIVLDGLSGPIDVEGTTYNSVMPAWETVLSDEEVAAVLTYVRTNWDNQASEVTVEDVRAVRTVSSARSNAWTADELTKPENSTIPGAAP